METELNFASDFSAFAAYGALSSYHLDNFDDSYYFDADLLDSDSYADILATLNGREEF